MIQPSLAGLVFLVGGNPARFGKVRRVLGVRDAKLIRAGTDGQPGRGLPLQAGWLTELVQAPERRQEDLQTRLDKLASERQGMKRS